MAIKAEVMFGLIRIPVQPIVMTSERGRITLKTLHKERRDGQPCLTPINEQKVCRACDMDVEVEDTVKGFEVTKGNFVPLTKEEVEEASAQRSPYIVIDKFVHPFDPIWVDKNYWLPSQNPEVEMLARVYATFSDALESTGLVGLGKAALWGKERPVMIAARLRMLTLHVLHSQAEFNEAPLPVTATINESEFEGLVAKIKEFEDAIEESDVEVASDQRLKELVAAKMSGAEWVAPEPEAVEPPTTNLLDALRGMKTPAKRKVTKKKVTA